MSPRTPLVRPGEYFEQHRDPKISGLGVFALYVVSSLAFLVALVDLFVAQIDNAPAEFTRAMNDVMGTMVAVTGLTMVVGLLVVAAIMHFGSGGDGTFGDAISVAAWAYAPNVIALVPTYVTAKRELSRLSFDGSDPHVLRSQLEVASTGSFGGPFSFLILVLTVAWSAYILAHGTAVTHDVDVGKAALPAALIGIGAFIFGL